MAEDFDYNPGAWKGHDFKSARAHYDRHVGRSYDEAKRKGVKAASLVPERVSTESTSPLVLMCDVTGSMGRWPAIMFSKLPYLDIEGKEYLGADMEICWAANGDLNDRYPFQARPFTTGTPLKDELEKLVIEGGGSGPVSGHECYEVGVAYFANNCDMPNAVKPVFIFVADEQPHKMLSRAHARQYAKVDLAQDATLDEVFDALKAKFDVYLVHKAYSPQSRAEWVRLLGEDHIADLQEPERVVDVIFGILARVTGRVAYFREEIEGRQTAAQVQTAYKALKTIHRIEDKGGKGHSTLHRPTGGKPTKSLL